MSRISTPRLRAFAATRESAHAALMRANENYRNARADLSRAGEALTRYDETDGLRAAARTGRRGAEIDYRARYIRDVQIAQEAVNAAEATQSAAHEAWQHAAALAGSAVDYARSIGQLPADMEAH